MDREILFRGKRKDNGEWIYGLTLQRGGDADPQHDKHLFLTPDGYSFPLEVDSETVCQYTGLQDKNGKKIFEGDIVQDYPFNAVVRFGEFETQVLKNIGFNLDWLNIVHYRQDLLWWIDKIEVVGNIFDNPKLGK